MAGPSRKIISIRIEAGCEGVFQVARSAAFEAVKEHGLSVILIAWKNNRTGESSPVVESCRCGIEGWEMYALSRGATVRVEVNGGELIFLFSPLEAELTIS